MPIYLYRCDGCQHDEELSTRMGQQPKDFTCPACNREGGMRRVLTAAAINGVSCDSRHPRCGAALEAPRQRERVQAGPGQGGEAAARLTRLGYPVLGPGSAPADLQALADRLAASGAAEPKLDEAGRPLPVQKGVDERMRAAILAQARELVPHLVATLEGLGMAELLAAWETIPRPQNPDSRTRG